MVANIHAMTHNINYLNVPIDNNGNNNTDVAGETNTKLTNFVQQITATTAVNDIPLKDRVENLKLEDEFWSEYFPSSWLTELQIHGVVLSFISKTGKIPTIEDVNQYLPENNITTPINESVAKSIINSFKGNTPENVDNGINDNRINYKTLRQQTITFYHEGILAKFNTEMPSEEELTSFSEIILNYKPFNNFADIELHRTFIHGIDVVLQRWKPNHENYCNNLSVTLITKIYKVIIEKDHTNPQINNSFVKLISNLDAMSIAKLIHHLCDIEHSSNRNNIDSAVIIFNILVAGLHPNLFVSAIRSIIFLDSRLFSSNYGVVMPHQGRSRNFGNLELLQIIPRLNMPSERRNNFLLLINNNLERKKALFYGAAMLPILGLYVACSLINDDNNVSVYTRIISTIGLIGECIFAFVLTHSNIQELNNQASRIIASLGGQTNDQGINNEISIIYKLSPQVQRNFTELLAKLPEDQQMLWNRMMGLLNHHNKLSQAFINLIGDSITAMNENQIIREKCMEIAERYRTTCADGMLIIFVLFYITIQCSKDILSLNDALTIAGTELQVNIVFEYVIKKLNDENTGEIDNENTERPNDPIEVVLWLLIELNKLGHIKLDGIDQMKFVNRAIEIMRTYRISLEEVIVIVKNLNPIELLTKVQEIFFENYNHIQRFKQESENSNSFMQKFEEISDKHSEKLEEVYNTNTTLNSDQILMSTDEIQTARAKALLEHIYSFIRNENVGDEEHK